VCARLLALNPRLGFATTSALVMTWRFDLAEICGAPKSAVRSGSSVKEEHVGPAALGA
jgi:hypothetical protein